MPRKTRSRVNTENGAPSAGNSDKTNNLKRKLKPDGSSKKAKVTSELSDVEDTVSDIKSEDIEELPAGLGKKLKENLKSIKNSENWVPTNWLQVLDNIRDMRKEGDAPVDTMGCDKCMDEESEPEVRRFHSLISLMLSSQTKDEVTFAAMTRLKEHGLTISNMLETSNEKLEELLKPVSFYKTKVKNVKKTCLVLKNEYNNDIPNTVELLCKLYGVGPKMAHLCMKTAWGVVSGIGVDTHVHRISNRIGWVETETKTPEATRIKLESWLPKEYWEEVNHLLVGFGQQTCKAVRPLCESCSNLSYCSYGQKQIRTSKKKKSK